MAKRKVFVSQLPLTIYVVHEADDNDGYLLANEHLADVDASDGRAIGVYKLVQEGKLEETRKIV